MSEAKGVFDLSAELEWTEWAAFQTARPPGSKLPKGGGFIRIRPIGTDLPISFTHANTALVNTFGEITQYRNNKYAQTGPPLTKRNPAACLWTLRNAAVVEFEYSCAASSYEGYTKKAAEKLRKVHLAALLYEYRTTVNSILVPLHIVLLDQNILNLLISKRSSVKCLVNTFKDQFHRFI